MSEQKNKFSALKGEHITLTADERTIIIFLRKNKKISESFIEMIKELEEKEGNSRFSVLKGGKPCGAAEKSSSEGSSKQNRNSF